MDQYTVSSIMGAISEFFPKQTSIAISDENNFIYYHPSKTIDLKIRPGDIIKQGTATQKALSVKHKISEYIDKNVYGIEYLGISFPVLNENRPTGCVTAILPPKTSPLVSTFLTVKMIDRWIPIQYEHIMYLEAQTRKTKIQTIRGEGCHKNNLGVLEGFLPEHLFIRVHRSYIVNVNFIDEIQPDSHSTFLLIMKDKTKIPVSQTYAAFFRRTLNF